MSLNRRNLLKTAGVVALGTAFGGTSSLIGAQPSAVKPTGLDPMLHVHPELRAALAQRPQMPATFSYSEAALPKLRAGAALRIPSPLPDVPVKEYRVPGPKGAPDVAIYVINSDPRGKRPLIQHMHGGGFFLGSAQSRIPNLQKMAQELDCVVASVEYRLAPETRWYGSLEDNYAALKWLHDNAEKLGVDRSRIAIMGESAGGGHAALLAIAARDRGEVPLVLQVLIYPMLDDRTGSTRQAPDHVGAVVWRPQDNGFGWRCFLGQEPGSANVPSAAVPARVTNVAGLPATFIGVGGIDLFVNEDIEYARRLTDSGVATELHLVPGAYHGFDNSVPDASISRQFTAAKLNAFRRAFGSPAVI